MTSISIERCQARIGDLLARPGMNKVLLAQRAEVHRNTLIGCELPGWNPEAKTLEKVMVAVDRLEKALAP